MFERGHQFNAATRYPRMRGGCLKRGRGCDFVGRLAYCLAIGGDEPGDDGVLRLGAAFEQPALDQKEIRAFARCHELTPA